MNIKWILNNKFHTKMGKRSVKETIFKVLAIFVVPIAVIFLYQFHNEIQRRAIEKPDLNLPKYSDLFPIFKYLVMLMVIRFICANYIFIYIAPYFVPEKKWNKEVRIEKIQRFGHVFFKLLFFVFVTIYGWILLKDKNWVPPIIGGYGETKYCWVNYPWLPVDDTMKDFYILELAYHSQSLIFQFFMKKRADFLEMVLHHLLTIFLISFSYLNNYIRVGTLVLLTHDFSDIFSYLIKTTMDSQRKNLIIFSYICLLLSWGFERIIIFPVVIIYSTLIESLKYAPSDYLYGWEFFNGFLLCLYCLHIYWYRSFIRLGIRFLNDGIMQDTIEDGNDKKLDPSHQFNGNSKKQTNGKHKN